jgi:hypothetical protein
MNILTNARKDFIRSLITEHGSKVSRKNILQFCAKNSYQRPNWLLGATCKSFKVARGQYDLQLLLDSQQVPELIKLEENAADISGEENADSNFNVPEIDPLFISYGHFNDIKTIIKSRLFYPAYISGLSGNGKTMMVEQACAVTGRKLFRVNMTEMTDEEDLFGGMRLIDGNTVWEHGPVIKAMLEGGILLLDEVDLSSTKALCLQPVLEGKGVLIKKISTFIKPAPGFNVIATANTKGQGSKDGKFIGSNIQNEAFLERFSITFEQEYPTPTIETKILSTLFQYRKLNDNAFIELLVNWADIIRRTYQEGAIDQLISTRRLVHIGYAYSIFGNKEKAVQLCINRFDNHVKEAFLDVLKKLTPEEPIREVDLRNDVSISTTTEADLLDLSANVF